MGVYLADQTLSFLHALILGAVLGALYDVFRILRIAVPTKRGVIFAQDVLFFLLCAITTFLFLLTSIDGVVRVFLLIGELLGAVLYYFTLGMLVMKVSKTIIGAVKAVLRFLVRYIFAPIWKLFYNIIAFLLRPFRFIGQIVKKSLQRLKYRLKVRRIVLYNHFIGYFEKKIHQKKPREKSIHGAEEENQ